MEINIIQGEPKHLMDCKIALQESELGRVYFTEENKITRVFNEAILKKEILVAIDKENKCMGFIWFTLDGAFNKYPYWHMIVVKKEYGNCGIGKVLLQHFEGVSAKTSSKVFLLVAEYNLRAKKLYEEIGYKHIGVIPNFYKDGVNENLMMKDI